MLPSSTSIANEAVHHIVLVTCVQFRGFFSSENSLKRKGYDSKEENSNCGSGKRRFAQSWTKEFPWLEFDGQKMFCKQCRDKTMKSDRSSTFVSGWTNFRIAV